MCRINKSELITSKRFAWGMGYDRECMLMINNTRAWMMIPCNNARLTDTKGEWVNMW